MEMIENSGQSAVEWYATWFDSPYYPILYRHRDEEEAQRFIDRLLVWLRPSPGARILDLACGKGRFAVYLAKKGFEVTGLDLSARSIREAQRQEGPNLSFYRHDMRLPFRVNYYDYLFSFFTSFGYFPSEKDDLRTLKTVRSGLCKDGVFVLEHPKQYQFDDAPGFVKMKKYANVHFSFFVEAQHDAE